MIAPPAAPLPASLLHAALDEMRDGCLALDARLTCTYANARARTLLATSPDAAGVGALEGRSLPDLLPPDVVAPLAAKLASTHLHPAPLSGSGEAIRLEALLGTPPRTIDVIARRTAEGVAIVLAERACPLAPDASPPSAPSSDDFYDATPISLVVLDATDLSFVRFNRMAHESMGYTREEFARLRVTDINVEPDEVPVAVRLVVEGPREQRFTRVHRRKDGTLRKVLIVSRRLDHGARPLLCAAWLDLEEHAELAQDVRAQALLLGSVLANVPLMVAITDEHGGMQWANQEIERVLGWAVTDLVGQRGVDVLLDDPDERAIARRAIAAGNGEWTEHLLLAPDGTRIPSTWSHVRLADGRLVSIGRDLREARAAEETRRLAEERLHLAMESADAGLWDFDQGSRRVFVSARIADMMGRPAVDQWTTERDWMECLHPDDLVVTQEAGRRCNEGASKRWDAQYRLRNARGEYRWVLSRGKGVDLDEHGVPRRIIGTIVDITDRHELEVQLNQARKMEAIGQLAGGVAHDFNNLLTVISANIEFLESDLVGESLRRPRVRRAIVELYGAADRATALVRQLLQFGRRQPVQARALRLADVLRSSTTLVQRLIGEEIALDVRIEDNVSIFADRTQMEQVVINLAINARDAMLTPAHGHAARGGTLSIWLGTVLLSEVEAVHWEGLSPGRWVELRVSDTGHGMDEATLEHLFEPFYTTKDLGKGSGLGLATVFGIVRSAGGAIRVTSEPGKGATFRILLPILSVSAAAAVAEGATATPVRVPAVESAAGSAGGAMGAQTVEPTGADRAPGEFDGAMILLVEDEAPVRDAVCAMLERAGFRVCTASNGHEGLARWRELGHEVDVVLTDVRMPGMGGVALVEEVRRLAPGTRVLFMTGYAELDKLPEADSRTARLEKPFRARAVREAIVALLRA